MQKNNDKGGAFLLIAIICGGIVGLTIFFAVLREIAQAFKHNTGEALLCTGVIGLIAYWVWKALRDN